MAASQRSSSVAKNCHHSPATGRSARLGIAEVCVAPEALIGTAREIADSIAGKSPLAVRLSKQTLNAIEDMSLRDGYRYEQDMTAAIARTEDAREAQRAFLEKRSPVFVGR